MGKIRIRKRHLIDCFNVYSWMLFSWLYFIQVVVYKANKLSVMMIFILIILIWIKYCQK